MRVHNLYAYADGESHFRDIEIELSEPMFDVGLLSKPRPVSSIMFRTSHRAPSSIGTTPHGRCTSQFSMDAWSLRQAMAKPGCSGPVNTAGGGYRRQMTPIQEPRRSRIPRDLRHDFNSP